MRDGRVVVDSVLHAVNWSPNNYRVEQHARPMAELGYSLSQSGLPAGYELAAGAVLRDWSVDDVAAMTFAESDTDFAVYHPTPIYAFHDGMSAPDKAAPFVDGYPRRMLGSYVALDPLDGKGALDELARRCDEYSPIGVKLYPTSWRGDTVQAWRMDDPSIAYPIYEAAAERGITTIAVHKAVPLGPAPTGPSFNPTDVEGAAAEFPELNFEIVHGGIAFAEETAWLLGRFPNIYVNLETVTTIMLHRPQLFARILMSMCHVGGLAVLDRMLWSTGSMQAHPRLCLEAFDRVEFTEQLRSEFGLFGELPAVSEEQKGGILGDNYLGMHGIDPAPWHEKIAGDQFDREDRNTVAPYSTTSVADQVIA